MIGKSTTNNRSLNRTSVNKFRKAMQAGEWIVNGEAIIIDSHGNILDGHHRLHALAETDEATIETVLISGVQSTAMKSIDTGKSRSMSDRFEMIAGLNGGIAKIVSHFWSALSGKPMGRGNANARWDRYDEFDGAFEMFNKHQVATQWILDRAYGLNVRDKKRVTKPVVQFNRFAKEQAFLWSCLGLIYEANPLMGEAITQDLLDVANNRGSMTANTLIALITQESHGRLTSRNREFYCARIIIALNAMIDGRDLSKIQYNGIKWPVLNIGAAGDSTQDLIEC